MSRSRKGLPVGKAALPRTGEWHLGSLSARVMAPGAHGRTGEGSLALRSPLRISEWGQSHRLTASTVPPPEAALRSR
jgi:hypothetical protein